MAFNIHYVCVEGPDDQAFIDQVVVPRIIAAGFDHAQTILWAEQPKGKRKEFVESFKGMEAVYTVLIDRDSLCITERKERFFTKHPFVHPNRIMVVCPEIEAWYAAGATSHVGKMLGPLLRDVDKITKEAFTRQAVSVAKTAKLAKLAILEDYDFNLACDRSSSLSYVARKIITPPDVTFAKM